MNISKLVAKLEEIENHTSGEGLKLINSLIEELIEIDLRLEKGFKKVLSKEKDEFLDELLQKGIDTGHIGEA
tara:strand:- start:54 stop:269 length:216 start_codon:yes stop_codon:yes gene_type:complete